MKRSPPLGLERPAALAGRPQVAETSANRRTFDYLREPACRLATALPRPLKADGAMCRCPQDGRGISRGTFHSGDAWPLVEGFFFCTTTANAIGSVQSAAKRRRRAVQNDVFTARQNVGLFAEVTPRVATTGK